MICSGQKKFARWTGGNIATVHHQRYALTASWTGDRRPDLQKKFLRYIYLKNWKINNIKIKKLLGRGGGGAAAPSVRRDGGWVATAAQTGSNGDRESRAVSGGRHKKKISATLTRGAHRHSNKWRVYFRETVGLALSFESFIFFTGLLASRHPMGTFSIWRSIDSTQHRIITFTTSKKYWE